MSEAEDPGRLLEHLFRRQAGRMTAHLARLLGPANLDAAEEAVQEAMLRALRSWPHDGIPEDPAAWLYRVAHNAAIDAIRRRKLADEKLPSLVEDLSRSADVPPGDPRVDEQLRDEELSMIFLCCHPEIPADARVALSLSVVGGFSAREIARGFLADERTIAQRLVRAKRQIRERHISLTMPAGADLAARLRSVLEVIYLMFNEGYAAHDGNELVRHDLCFEALRLTRLLAASSVATPTVHALTALVALQAARLAARTSESGDLVLLEEQDRSRWDERLISLGFYHFERMMAGDELTEYHVQAAIAATYARPGPVLWDVILELYDQLAANGSPVVLLNRVVVVERVHGPARAMEELERISPMQDYYLYLAVRGHLLAKLGNYADGAVSFRAALECPCSEPERRFLRRKLAACESAERSTYPESGAALRLGRPSERG